MGSIELNVKDSDAWQGGRNAGYVRKVEEKMAALDAGSIADKAMKDARPSAGERIKESISGAAGAVRDGVADRMRQRERDRERDAGEIFGEVIRKNYLVVHENGKVRLYEPSAKEPTITFDAKKISTTHDKGAAIEDSVKLALDRGWTSLKVSGTDEFKDAVWLEAKKYDLKVGHKPSPLVRAEFERWRETNELRPIPQRSGIESPTNQQGQSPSPAPAAPEKAQRDLAADYLKSTAQQRLSDPQLRNAELSARAAREIATQKFGAENPKLPIALANVDKIVSDRLRTGHTFSAPSIAAPTPKIPTLSRPKHEHRPDRPRM